MQARAVPRAAEFLDRAGPLLLADEARHNLILSLVAVLRDRPEVYPEFGLWVVEEAGRPLAAALITPPFNLVLADAADDGALPLLAAAVRRSGLPVPGVMGNRPTVDGFAEAWAGAGTAPRLLMEQGVFALERVETVDEAAGSPRRAVPDDRARVLEWMYAFAAEALPEEPQVPERLERMIDHRLDPATSDAGFWFWETGGAVVSLVGYGGPLPGGGIRIGPVYTPPDCRRRGYGTSLVAAVSSWLLAHGRRRCFLYTDLANPISNSIYRKVGYRQVAEAATYGCESAG